MYFFKKNLNKKKYLCVCGGGGRGTRVSDFFYKDAKFLFLFF